MAECNFLVRLISSNVPYIFHIIDIINELKWDLMIKSEMIKNSYGSTLLY